MLKTGSVDAAENNWNSYDSMEHDKVAPYYIEDGHTRIPELVLMSRVTAAQLSDEDLQIVRECARASAEKEREAWEEREKLSRIHVLEEGTRIISFSEYEIGKLRTMTEPLYEKYCGEYMDLIAKIRNMRKKVR